MAISVGKSSLLVCCSVGFVKTGTSHMIVGTGDIYFPCRCMFIVLISNLFTYHPVAITSHLIVSISVFRWCKCCASCNNMFNVFFCLTAHFEFTVIKLLHDVPLMIMHIGRLILGCYY